MAEVEWTRVEQVVADAAECTVCQEMFKTPKLLPCGHTFCVGCLQQWSTEQQEREEDDVSYDRQRCSCPICRKPFRIPPGGVGQLPKNMYVDKMQRCVDELMNDLDNVVERLDEVTRQAKDERRKSDAVERFLNDQFQDSRGEVEQLVDQLKASQQRERNLLEQVSLLKAEAASLAESNSHLNASTANSHVVDLARTGIVRSVHTLSDGGGDVTAITCLSGKLFVLRERLPDHSTDIEVFDVATLRFRGRLTTFTVHGRLKLRGIDRATDMTSCATTHCLCVSSYKNKSIYRIKLTGKLVAQWNVTDGPFGVTALASSNMLVTCLDGNRLKEYTPIGKLVREVKLPGDIINPLHAVPVRAAPAGGGQQVYMVSHGWQTALVHRVGLVSADGKLVKTFGGPLASERTHLDLVSRLTLSDNTDNVLIVDRNSRRVVRLSQTLDDCSVLLTGDEHGLDNVTTTCCSGNNDNNNDQQRLLYVAGQTSSGKQLILVINSEILQPATDTGPAK